MAAAPPPDAAQELAALLATRAAESGLAAGDLTIWSVPLAASPTLSTSQRVVLEKFLRARDGAVPVACDMLVATLKWRKEFDMPALDTEAFPPEIAALGEVRGRDRAGNPLTFNYYGKMDQAALFRDQDATERNTKAFIRWRVWLMESAIKQCDFENGVEHISQIHDYEGTSFFPSKQMKAISRQIISLFQDNYPEFLSAKLFVHVPSWMESVYALMSVFVNSRTRSKFRMVSPANVVGELFALAPVQGLPEKYSLGVGRDTGEMKQVTVKPRSKVVVDLDEGVFSDNPSSPRDVSVWFFAASYDISVKLVTSVENSKDEPAVVASMEKQASGRVSASKSELQPSPAHRGRVVFDNSYSLLTEKKVYYHLG